MGKQQGRSRAGTFRTLGMVLTVCLGLFASTSTSTSASADDLDDQQALTEAQQAATAAATAALEGALEGTEASLAQAYIELEGIQAQIPVAEAQLAAAQAELERLQREAAIIDERLTAAQTEETTITTQITEDTAKADEITDSIGQMAREAYRGDVSTSSLSVMFDAQNAQDFIEESSLSTTALRTQTQALRGLDQINGVNRNRQTRLAAVRVEITDLKAEADAKVVDADVARQAAADRKATLDTLLAQAQEKTAYVESQRAQQEAQIADLEAQQASLAATLAQIAEQQRQRDAETGASPPSLTGSRPLGYPTPSPVHITSDYGMRLHPILGYWRLHAGTDFRAYCGNPIIAAADGTVQWAKLLSGFGNQVMLNHGTYNGQSLMTSYNHMSSFAVSTGDHVSKGQVVGYSGTTGTSEVCHVHFEVYLDGSTVNPVDYIG